MSEIIESMTQQQKKELIEKSDIYKALERFTVFINMLIDFGEEELKFILDSNNLKELIKGQPDMVDKLKNYKLERLIELNNVIEKDKEDLKASSC